MPSSHLPRQQGGNRGPASPSSSSSSGPKALAPPQPRPAAAPAPAGAATPGPRGLQPAQGVARAACSSCCSGRHREGGPSERARAAEPAGSRQAGRQFGNSGRCHRFPWAQGWLRRGARGGHRGGWGWLRLLVGDRGWGGDGGWELHTRRGCSPWGGDPRAEGSCAEGGVAAWAWRDVAPAELAPRPRWRPVALPLINSLSLERSARPESHMSPARSQLLLTHFE